MRRHLWRLGWLVLAALALTVARVAVNPLTVRASAPASRVTTAELQAWLKDGRALTVIDARDRLFFLDGHVVGAVNVPRRGLTDSEVLGKISPLAVKSATVVVYCTDRDCTDSAWLAAQLSRLGWQHVWVLDGGWTAWLSAGGEVAK